MTAIKYRCADVDGLKIFYREAGAADAPVDRCLRRAIGESVRRPSLTPAPFRGNTPHRTESPPRVTCVSCFHAIPCHWRFVHSESTDEQ